MEFPDFSNSMQNLRKKCRHRQARKNILVSILNILVSPIIMLDDPFTS